MRPALSRAAIVLAPLLLAGCGATPRESGTVAPIPVKAVAVGGSAIAADSVTFAGTIRRDREAQLAFRLGGTVGAVPARIGQVLPAGALVAALDATGYSAGVARQAAEVARLERAVGRYGPLVEAGAVADAQARDTRDALAAARAGLAAARFDLAGARLLMPFRGVVVARRVEQGEAVGAGQVVATVADLTAPLLATAQVTPGLARRLQPGAATTVSAAGLAPMSGRVLRVAGGSDSRSGTVAIDVALPASAMLGSGTAVSVRFVLPPPGEGVPTDRAGFIVPAEALLAAQGSRATVFVIDRQGRARRRAVRFGGFVDQAARIGGLPAGTRVITAGAGFVAEGDAVTVAGA